MAHKLIKDMSQHAYEMQRLINESQMQPSKLNRVTIIENQSFPNGLHQAITSTAEGAFKSRINSFWEEQIQCEKARQYEAMFRGVHRREEQRIIRPDSYFIPEISTESVGLFEKLFGKGSKK